jgi:hypothetical protein
MRFLILILFLILNQVNTYAQELQAYKNIPDGYSITVEHIENATWDEEVIVRVYDKTKKTKFIEVKSQGLYYDGENLQVDFSKQKGIMYKDFNFDGILDFGIYTGPWGNYGLPYYNFYLQKNGQFIHNKEFSELTMDNFEIDEKRERLIVTYNYGALISNGVVEYSVENNNLQLRKQRSRRIDFAPFAKFSTVEYDKEGNQVDGSFEIYYYFKDGRDAPNAFFEAEIMNNKSQKIILVNIYKTLYFGIVDKNSTVVSLIHPVLQENNFGNFKLETQKNTTSLKFSINTEKYELIQTEKDGRVINLELRVIGIDGMKKYYGNTNTIAGNINSILTKGYVNVKIEETKRKHEAETEAKRKAIEAAAKKKAIEDAKKKAIEDAKKKAGDKFKNKPGNGDGNNTGNAGNPNSNKPGGGTTDSGADIAGRRVSNRPQPPTNPGVNGNVVIKICIDNNGNVISANFTQEGSAITSAAAIQVAVANAKKWKFNTDAMAPDKQCGTIRYNYKN